MGGEVKRYKAKVDNSPFRTEKKRRKERKKERKKEGHNERSDGRTRLCATRAATVTGAQWAQRGSLADLTALFYAVIAV